MLMGFDDAPSPFALDFGEWSEQEDQDRFDDLFPHLVAWESSPQDSVLCLKDECSSSCVNCGEDTHWLYRDFHIFVCSVKCLKEHLDTIRPTISFVFKPGGPRER